MSRPESKQEHIDHSYRNENIYYSHQRLAPEIRKLFQENESYLTADDVQKRKKEMFIKFMFLRKLDKMCEGLNEYFTENKEELQKKRDKEERKRKR